MSKCEECGRKIGLPDEMVARLVAGGCSVHEPTICWVCRPPSDFEPVKPRPRWLAFLYRLMERVRL